MGSANMLSSCSIHISIAQYYDNFFPKLQSFNHRGKTRFVNFNLERSSRSFQKINIGISSYCKRSELIDFEERKSGNEGQEPIAISLWTPEVTVNLQPIKECTAAFQTIEVVKKHKENCLGFCTTHQAADLITVRKEIEQCYELIHRLGRGAIYIGSARPGSNHPHYTQALELSKKIANLLDCTTWTGAGPGLMDAAIRGALQAGKPVGGFKIDKEAGQWSSTGSHPYLSPDTYLTCRFFSARKHGFVDAAVRNSPSDRTAAIALPGGVGTLDEMFEILALIQLQRIGSQLPVPFVLMNYDDYYSKLLDFLDDCEHWGNLAKGEVASLWKVCSNNKEALTYLARFYGLPVNDADLKEQETMIS